MLEGWRVMHRNFKLYLQALLFLVLIFVPASAARAQNKATEMKPVNSSDSMAQEVARARQGIAAGNAKWIEAWVKSDPAMIVSTFADDAIELRPDGTVIKGHKQILEHIKESMQRLGAGVVLTVTTSNVWLDGDKAYETGKSLYKYSANGQPKTFEARYVSIWRRERDGAWKLFMDMGVPKD